MYVMLHFNYATKWIIVNHYELDFFGRFTISTYSTNTLNNVFNNAFFLFYWYNLKEFCVFICFADLWRYGRRKTANFSMTNNLSVIGIGIIYVDIVNAAKLVHYISGIVLCSAAAVSRISSNAGHNGSVVAFSRASIIRCQTTGLNGDEPARRSLRCWTWT